MPDGALDDSAAGIDRAAGEIFEVSATGSAPIWRPTLLRTTFLGGLATLARLASALLVTKLVAVAAGPAAVASLGQFGAFVAMTVAFSGGGISAGVTKYVAEYGGRSAAQQTLLRTALSVTILASALCSALVLLLSPGLGRWLLGSRVDFRVFWLFAAAVPLASLGGLVLAILNGTRDTAGAVRLTLAGAATTLLLSGALALRFGLAGALAGLAVAPGIAGLFAVVVARRRSWYRLLVPPSRPDAQVLRRLSGYAVMMATTATALPLATIYIRAHLASAVSWDAAGLWQALWQISDGYLLIISTALGMYYLPRLSEITDAAELRREIRRAFGTLLPLTAAAALAIYLTRDLIIWLLLSAPFTAMRTWFAYQLLGDVLKVASWLLSYLLLARAMTWTFVATEIGFAVSFAALSVVCIDRWGPVGVTYAFAANYLAYLLMMAWIFRREAGLVR